MTDDNETGDAQAIAAFYSQTGEMVGDDQNEKITFDPKIGLAMESLVPGMSLEQLWRVM